MFSFYSDKQQTFLRFDDLYICWTRYKEEYSKDFHIDRPFCDYTYGWGQETPISYMSLEADRALMEDKLYLAGDDANEDTVDEDHLQSVQDVMFEMEELHDRNQKENDNE